MELHSLINTYLKVLLIMLKSMISQDLIFWSIQQKASSLRITFPIIETVWEDQLVQSLSDWHRNFEVPNREILGGFTWNGLWQFIRSQVCTDTCPNGMCKTDPPFVVGVRGHARGTSLNYLQENEIYVGYVLYYYHWLEESRLSRSVSVWPHCFMIWDTMIGCVSKWLAVKCCTSNQRY